MPNTRVLFKSIPVGAATKDTFDIVHDDSFDVNNQELVPDSVLIKTTWLSLDPYMRGRMRKPELESYSAAFTVGQPLAGHGVGVVVKSTSTKYKEGDAVLGFLPWASYAVVSAAFVTRKINSSDTPALPHETWLGLLGMPSFTAYVGLITIGKPKAGETLFVSAAAGAVGQVVGQIGKRLGLRVVGSCGTDEKVDFLVNKLGFDAAFNYNKHNIRDKLAELCPQGIDIYFENVGGETLDAVLTLMNVGGRIPVCGMISQYNGAGDGIKNLMQVIPKRILIQGFLQTDFVKDHHEDFLKWMFEHAMDGSFVYEQTVAEGIESLPEAFIGMMAGKNTGKQLVKL
ncbi:UNVERIFIED_CONTAM: hypothetical protein HDU68_005417 [Siphonaria sp. JEL0065]|nr:hypothetical protein HDU68_005417 [Siphonaria sp. JEL0065]